MSRLLAFVLAGCASTAIAADKFFPINIQPYASGKLTESFGSGRPGSDLVELPKGDQVLADVRFNIGEKLIQLASEREEFQKKPEKAEGIKDDHQFAKLHSLHATQDGAFEPWHVDDDTVVGEIRINYKDRSAVIVPIVYGRDLRDWFFVAGDTDANGCRVAWTGDNDLAKSVGSRI